MTRLVCHELCFRFPGGHRAGPLSFEAERGVVWLDGPNGSGKTTLMRCVAGELVCTSGRVRVHGLDPVRRARAREGIGYMPAQPDTPDFLTVREAWTCVAALRGRPSWPGEAVCDALGLPGELPIAHASSGERRKVELLVALAADPPLLLLDEPFAHLDVQTCQRLLSWIEGWRTRRLIVLTGHGERPLEPDQVIALPFLVFGRDNARVDGGPGPHDRL